MDKTLAVLFTRKIANNKVILDVNSKAINTANSAKFLDIIFDSKLIWSEHVDYIEGKCKKRPNFMRSVAGNT